MIKNKILIYLLAITLLFMLNLTLYGENIDFGFGFGHEVVNNAYTSYKIYDDTSSWKSLLEFPVDSNLKTINFKMNSIDFTMKFNEDVKNKLLFKDSDWLGNNFNKTPYIYAEANSIQNTNIYNLKYKYNKLKKKQHEFSYGFGYEKRYYEHFIYNANIKYESGEENYIDETCLYYNINYHLPYLFLNYKFNYNKNMSFSLEYSNSPLIYVKDYDDHILRNKISESKATGNGESFTFGINFKTINNFVINTTINKSKYSALGHQTQKFEKNKKVYDDIISEFNLKTTSFSLALNYIF